ncbi:hypothetical protein [Phenylobacterium sp.]|nr:hypothetical protein [Phenylobacterium sp.]
MPTARSPQDIREEDLAFVALVAKLGSAAARFQDEPVVYRTFAPQRRPS